MAVAGRHRKSFLRVWLPQLGMAALLTFIAILFAMLYIYIVLTLLNKFA